MKQNTKNEIKDWLQLIALCAAGGIVVFHVNSVFGPTTPANAEQKPNGIERVVEKIDTIAHGDTIDGTGRVRVTREMFLDNMKRSQPQR